MNAEMKWLRSDKNRVAHLCVINRDDPANIKAAAICNNRALFNWTGAATLENPRCETCLNMESSPRAIEFILPDSGKRIIVREAK